MTRPTARVAEGSEAELVDLARRGDLEAFELLAAPHLRELHLHCYRMLGSLHEADDLVQETLLRAWRAVGRFEARSSVRTWLYRIATNACLNALAARPRRALPSGLVPSCDPLDPPPEPVLEPIWLEPYPDRLLDELDDPAARYARRETIELAFLAAIHLLPPRQRAVLLLRDVLDWSATEVAELLGTTTASVNSALQRARASLERWNDEGAPIGPPTAEERAILDHYLRAFERADVPALARILADEVEMTMPPDPAWFRGRDDVMRFIEYRVFRVRGPLVLESTAANRSPAVALYQQGASGQTALSIQVLGVAGGLVERIDGFVGDELFPAFGLPMERS
jgi:RNA polymerase sigma-70 factor (ECF subfamily)